MKPRNISTTRPPLLLVLILFGLACSENGGPTVPGDSMPPASPATPPAPPPGPPATIVPHAPTSQNGVVADSVWSPPEVTVLDLNNNLLEGVAISCTVLTGGGSVSRPAKTTDRWGQARCGAWTLGSTPGENTLAVAVAGIAPIIFAAAGHDSAYFENYELQSVGGIAVPRRYPATVLYSGKIRFAQDSTFDLAALYGNQLGEIVSWGYTGRFELDGETISFFHLGVPTASGQVIGDLLTVRYLGDEAPEPEVYRRTQ